MLSFVKFLDFVLAAVVILIELHLHIAHKLVPKPLLVEPVWEVLSVVNQIFVISYLNT